jgi:hypothetical protein
MEKSEYIRSVMKKLKCSKTKKKEIKKQLDSDISSALQDGESLEMIYQRMGTPSEMAKDFNDNLSESERKALRKSRLIRIVGIITGIVLVLCLFVYWFLPKAREIEKSSIFNKEDVEKQAQTVIDLLNNKEYETLQKEYSDDTMKKYLTQETMEEVKEDLKSNWGEFISYSKAYITELTQVGKRYVVVQLNATYENVSVTYTITFDEKMKLAGLYMK